MEVKDIERLIDEWLCDNEGSCTERYRERIRGIIHKTINAVTAEFADKVPPKGSLPWAWQQRINGYRTKHSDGTELDNRTHRLDGWSVVPAEVKPMTFVEAVRDCRKNFRSEHFAVGFEVFTDGFGGIMIRNPARTETRYTPTMREMLSKWYAC